VRRKRGGVWVRGAMGIMVEVGKGFREWVTGEGGGREMDMGKEREVVEDGRSGFEIIIPSGYAQMDRQESGHPLGLKKGSGEEIMVD
jgi:hypothetical protein